MKKALVKTIGFQLIFGTITLLVYLLGYFLLEQIIDILVFPFSILFTILSFILYGFVLSKHINIDFDNKKKVLYLLDFSLCSVLFTVFALIENDLLNIICIIFQQTYYFVSEITNNEPNFIFVLAIFLIENAIKAFVVILFSKKYIAKNNNQ